MGRALAKSAASSSFASDVTDDVHGCKGSGLEDAQLAELRHLEDAEKRGEHLPGLGVGGDEVAPAGALANGEHRANHGDRAGDVEGPGDDLVHRRLPNG